MRKIPAEVQRVAASIADDWCMPECEEALSTAIANAILAERERCATIARTSLPEHEYGSNFARAGALIAEAMMGSDNRSGISRRWEPSHNQRDG